MALSDRPLLTTEFPDASSFRPVDSSVYMFGTRDEERTRHVNAWRSTVLNLTVIELVERDLEVILLPHEGDREIALRDVDELKSMLSVSSGRPIYLDITGLSNHVWPAILKIALDMRMTVNIVYVEPQDYAYSRSPRESLFFDLSDHILGISPIPQFNTLAEPEEDSVTLVPLLGFEGARFQHLLEYVQPPGDNIDPIVGVPGFRAEYPFFAYQGNQIPLRESGSYRNVRYAKANCPFSLFYVLGDISTHYPIDQFFKVGLIGTKPHALGAVLFALAYPRRVELVYDHTIHRPKRTSGQSRALVYPVSTFIERIRAI